MSSVWKNKMQRNASGVVAEERGSNVQVTAWSNVQATAWSSVQYATFMDSTLYATYYGATYGHQRLWSSVWTTLLNGEQRSIIGSYKGH